MNATNRRHWLVAATARAVQRVMNTRVMKGGACFRPPGSRVQGPGCQGSALRWDEEATAYHTQCEGTVCIRRRRSSNPSSVRRPSVVRHRLKNLHYRSTNTSKSLRNRRRSVTYIQEYSEKRSKCATAGWIGFAADSRKTLSVYSVYCCTVHAL